MDLFDSNPTSYETLFILYFIILLDTTFNNFVIPWDVKKKVDCWIILITNGAVIQVQGYENGSPSLKFEY